MRDGDLANPARWKEILTRFPQLRINFGHFGNLEGEWAATILNYIREYENAYTDISFFFREKHSAEIKKLLNDPVAGGKILYGSDYPLIIPFLPADGSYQTFLMPVKKGLDSLFQKISSDNPGKFLRLP